MLSIVKQLSTERDMKMDKLKSISIIFALGAIPELACAQATDHTHETRPLEEKWGEIDTQGLEALLNSKVPLTIVDARSDKYFDGTLIRGARRLPAGSPQDLIAKILP